MTSGEKSVESRTARLAEQLWVAHGSPEDGYHEFYVQAVEELAFVDAIRAAKGRTAFGRRPSSGRAIPHGTRKDPA